MSKRKPYIPIEKIEGEVWKPIIGYEELYAVSNMCRVKMLGREWLRVNGNEIQERFSFERLVPPFLSHNGYHRIALYKNRKVKKYQLHRVVAEAFINNPENKKEINHINGVKLDNRPENLEWCTRQENAIHAVKMGFIKPMKRGNNPNAKRIRCTTLGIDFDCAADVQDALDVCLDSIKRVAHGHKLHVKGFVFQFI